MSVISNKCQLSHQTFLLLCPFAIFILQFLKFSTIISVLRLPNSAGRNHKTRLNTIHFKPRCLSEITTAARNPLDSSNSQSAHLVCWSRVKAWEPESLEFVSQPRVSLRALNKLHSLKIPFPTFKYWQHILHRAFGKIKWVSACKLLGMVPGKR